MKSYTINPTRKDNLPPHGTRSRYVHHHCSCSECREANARYKSQKIREYQTLAASKAAGVSNESVKTYEAKLVHGLPSAFYWYQCRCEVCKQAVKLYRRR